MLAERPALRGLVHGSRIEPAMNVLALLTDCFGGYGGIAQYNRDFVTALSHHPRLALLEILPRVAPQPLTRTPDRTRQLPAVHNPFLYSVLALFRSMVRRPEFIFCGHLYHAPLAILLKRLSGAKVVMQMHGTEVWKELPQSLVRSLQKADCVLCVSEDTRQRLLSQCPLAEERVRVVHNTVRPQFMLGDRTAARNQFDLGNEFVMLSVSRLAEAGYKGQDRVIRAMPALIAAGHDLRYLIAGEGPDRDRLERLAVETGVAERVTFLGNVSDEELPILYRAADLFVLPSTGEGFGIVYAEAMASGTPALGIDLGGVREALGGDPLGFAASIEAFEGTLQAAIERSATLSSDERTALSARTIDRFGSERFRATLLATLEPYL